jgi:alpha-beta hydrolase superfamily lysophospholipase
MTLKEILVFLVGALLGGGGLTGLMFGLFRRYIDKKLAASESERDKKIKRKQIDDKLCHAYGRMFFWVYKYIVTGSHNGDLDKAFKDLEDAEALKKELDCEIIADHEVDK